MVTIEFRALVSNSAALICMQDSESSMMKLHDWKFAVVLME